MNAKRVASLIREIAERRRALIALELELADAIEQEEPKRVKKRKVAPATGEVSQAEKDAARRALRKAGVAA